MEDSKRCCKPDYKQAGMRLDPTGTSLEALLSNNPIFVKQSRQDQFRGVRRKILDLDSLDFAYGETALNPPDIFLQPPDHDLSERRLAHFDTPREAVRVQQFQQCGEATGVAVVRRCRQEQPVLEPA